MCYLPKIPFTACSKSAGKTTVLELSDSDNSRMASIYFSPNK
ncbi:hypothetical protein BMETH_768_1 [methanotrophic bacterial endosymbiont of Bathymodiolus sp.]|nr:hypothetical protein BMETH_768_1 [methanotrophic bacterial endosymbiont of Bathymodiolus sp.]